jgi:membrane-associated PAP2 superfamily phosphatase
MGDSLNLLAAGALATGYLVVALFFARFYRDTRERLFGWFTAAFILLAAQRIALSVFSADARATTLLYGLRLVAFLVILYAIVDKNRGEREGAG